MTDEHRNAITLSAMEGWKKWSTLKNHQGIKGPIINYEGGGGGGLESEVSSP